MIEVKDIKGLKELYDKLQTLPVKMEKKLMAKAMRRGVNEFTKAARSKAPRGNKGLLLRSIKTKSLRGNKGDVKFGTVSTAPHAHLVEYGTAAHKVTAGMRRGAPTDKKVLADVTRGIIFGKTVTVSARPRPFMRPAFDENWEKAIEAFRDNLSNNIEELVK